jgi:demethylspheroidene O-methyltransferase
MKRLPRVESWLEGWRAARDRLLASPDFVTWASAFPLTRWIARRRARALFDLCAGFVYSQVLLACVRLRVLDLLRDGPRAAVDIAAEVALPPAAADRLLRAAAALKLVEPRSGGRYGLGPLGAALAGNPAVAAMIEHHEMLYGDLRDPVAVLRRGPGHTALARYWAYAGAADPGALGVERVAAYTDLMSASQPLVAEEVLHAYPFAGHRCLLDVGGGDGTFLAAVAHRFPTLRLQLFDLPEVAARARERLDALGLARRVQCHGGDFLRDPLPAGADLATLVRVIHDHDDPIASDLLAAVYRVLPAGGVVLVAEPLAGVAGGQASMSAVYFDWYFWAMGQGKSRKFNEIKYLMKSVGFVDVRLLPTRKPWQVAVVSACKPGAATFVN